MNHSKEFWAEVEGIFPNYAKAKRWLKENGILLEI
jgi:predicted metal-dependent hydrolase